MKKTVPKTGVLTSLFALTKARLTAMVTLTTATGYLLATGRLDRGLIAPMLGVFLLASGAVALNQVQEAKLDARMERTRGRPIPAGRLDRTSGLFLAIILILLGAYFLSTVPSKAYALLALGGLAVLWYNGVYTLLKRVTAFAVVPGALIGAIGPLIGWVAGLPLSAGSPSGRGLHQAAGAASAVGWGGTGGPASLILPMAGFFFAWQIPHFWLLVLKHGDEYAAAGLPSLTRVFSREQLARITFMWVAAAAGIGAMLAAQPGRFDGGSRPSSLGFLGNLGYPSQFTAACSLIVLAGSVWLVVQVARRLLGNDSDQTSGYRLAFVYINIYGLLVMASLVVGSLLPVTRP